MSYATGQRVKNIDGKGVHGTVTTVSLLDDDETEVLTILWDDGTETQLPAKDVQPA